MQKKRKGQPNKKSNFHPQNPHQGKYDFEKLIASCPELSPFVFTNQYGNQSINFFDPEAVIMLNKALLKHHYKVDFWTIPPNHLCPPIPGRADYIHHLADLLSATNPREIPTGEEIKCLDIGVGANCIYPIIGSQTFNWKFVGSDIDPNSITAAENIIKENPNLKNNIEIRLQNNKKNIFKGIIQEGEYYHLTICNPPFHASPEEAEKGTRRKLKNLTSKEIDQIVLNFGGKSNELWTKGGEKKFIKNMIKESQLYANSVLWFSTLVSKQSNLNAIYDALKNVATAEVKTIPMEQGQKISRIVAWKF